MNKPSLNSGHKTMGSWLLCSPEVGLVNRLACLMVNTGWSRNLPS